ncbi:MAG TPA: hypothetical protein VFM98_12430 [Ramlibacter sp.]|uniref:hypothetical protein n=1 Tax=Ramlibacter sp. TaxID=1917967 RepID=UPI002D808155|nr:hypothetical protein [Ramlibacter sp.]HET8746406.1 hypothetical protein [Ramlibacter sp.]
MQGAHQVASGAGADEPGPLDDWRRAHDALLAHERAFAQLVKRLAHGQATRHEVEGKRLELLALRALADAVLQKGFGLPPAAPDRRRGAA